MIAAFVALALAAQASTAPVEPTEPAPPDVQPPAAQQSAESDGKVKYTRWQEAATASGVVSFVGLVIGGVGVPGLVGIGAFAIGVAMPPEVLYGSAVVGGALGAAAGGTLGALPTVEWYGWPVVGAAGALGSLIGLVPLYFIGVSTSSDPDLAEKLSPLQSAALVGAMAGAGGGAALAGAFFALPDEGPEKVTGHKQQ